MKSLAHDLSHVVRRFLRDEDGTIITETVIVLPLLLWAYIGLFVYWDCFRSLNTVQKAAYTVSDMLSRAQTGISAGYVDGLKRALEYLIDQDKNARMRVTSVTWNDASTQFEVHWSHSSDQSDMPPLSTATLQNYSAQIPTMTAGDYVVIIEVTVPYEPSFNVGLTAQTFGEFIVTRPRFLPCIPLNSIPCPV